MKPLITVIGLLFLYLLTASIFKAWAFVYQFEAPPVRPSPNVSRPGFEPIVSFANAYAWPYDQIASIRPLTKITVPYHRQLHQYFVDRRVAKEGPP